MLRGAVVFGLGMLTGFVGALYGVASSMQSDPEWWRRMTDKFRRPAPPAPVERASTQKFGITDYDPTKFRATWRGDTSG